MSAPIGGGPTVYPHTHNGRNRKHHVAILAPLRPWLACVPHSMPSHGGRVSSFVLDEEEAMKLFDDNITAKDIEDIFVYSPIKMRKRASWNELYKHRNVLGDAFTASKGFLLKQIPLTVQLGKALRKQHVSFNEESLEKAAYRLRCMMSHVRGTRMGGRRQHVSRLSMGSSLSYDWRDRLLTRAMRVFCRRRRSRRTLRTSRRQRRRDRSH